MLAVEDLLPLIVTAATLAVGLNLWLFRRRRGRMRAWQIDPNAWRSFADAHGFGFLPDARKPAMYGGYNDVRVRVEASITAMEVEHALKTDRTDYLAGTTFTAGLGARVPEGLHLRRQRLFDGVLNQLVTGEGEILTEDKPVDDAFLIHGKDPDAVAALLLDPQVREALLALAAADGDVTLDETGVRIDIPTFVTDTTRLRRHLDRLTGLVHAIRAVAPPTVGEKAADGQIVRASIAALPKRKRGLRGILQAATSAGFTATAAGRELLKEVPGQPCTIVLEVERVEPHLSRLGVGDGITAVGRLEGWTTRVDAHLIDGAAEIARTIKPGQRVHCEGVVDNYDALRDRAEFTSDLPPEIQGDALAASATPAPARPAVGPSAALSAPGPSAASATPAPAGLAAAGTRTRLKPRPGDVKPPVVVPLASPFVAQADAALQSGSITAVLEALHSGREARSHLLLTLPEGRRWTLGVLVERAEKTPSWKADAELRGGRTVHGLEDGSGKRVELRLPPARNEELDAAGIGELVSAEAVIAGWDELGEHAVLEARAPA